MIDPGNLKKMSEDEIIECCSNIADWGFNDYEEWEQQSAVYGLLDLYKKQQEEIEDWKFTSKYVEDNYISKDKIREKIKEKQDRINKLHPASDIVIIDDLENQIDCYKELLKEDNNERRRKKHSNE